MANQYYFGNTNDGYIGTIKDGIKTPFSSSIESFIEDSQYILDILNQHTELLNNEFQWLSYHVFNSRQTRLDLDKLNLLKTGINKEINNRILSNKQLKNIILKVFNDSEILGNPIYLDDDYINIVQTQDEKGINNNINILFNRDLNLTSAMNYQIAKLYQQSEESLENINKGYANLEKLAENIMNNKSLPDKSLFKKKALFDSNLEILNEKSKIPKIQLEEFKNSLKNIAFDHSVKIIIKFFEHIKTLETAENLDNKMSAKAVIDLKIKNFAFRTNKKIVNTNKKSII